MIINGRELKRNIKLVYFSSSYKGATILSNVCSRYDSMQQKITKGDNRTIKVISYD